MFTLSQNEYLFIYFILSIHHMVLINMCEKILFSNVVHQMEEYKSLLLSTYFKTHIRKHVNRLEPTFIYISVHI